jgi:hypothetical protein
MATTPSFISTPRIAFCAVTTANTALDGSGSPTLLMTGVAAGTRVLEIDIQCSATSAAGLVNIFLSTDGGTTKSLFDQIAVTAATVSATVKGNRNTATYANLILPDTNAKLYATTTITQNINVFALAGDLT